MARTDWLTSSIAALANTKNLDFIGVAPSWERVLITTWLEHGSERPRKLNRTRQVAET
jgi:hypothetical protein